MEEDLNFNVISAFSLETLADGLIKAMKSESEGLPPLAEQTVLVMNPAQGSWLKQYIAEKTGICANVNFSSPDRYFNHLLCRGNAVSGTFEQTPLSWKIFKTLKKNESARISDFNFRENGENDLMTLAGSLANIFWTYQTHRPEMIRRWQKSENDDAFLKEEINPDFTAGYKKQKKLWQELEFEDNDVPACRFCRFLNAKKFSGTLPKALFVFAPTAMPRLHYKFLKKLAGLGVKIHFFYHNLSKDLWTETKNEKQILKGRTRSRPQLEDESKWLKEVQGNELLTSWGKAARKMTMQLIDDGKLDEAEFVPDEKNLLKRVQSSVRGNIQKPVPADFDENDDSLVIHEAHSPMREVEIVYDDLCKLFTKNKELRSRDVFVMMPSVSDYTAAIHAVFGAKDSPFRYSVSDRKPGDAMPAVRTFLKILDIVQDNFKASEILGLLECRAAAKKFGFDGESLKNLTEIIRKTNWRNGFDEKSRLEELKKIGGNALDGGNDYFFQNSYQFAKRRLILGLTTGDGHAGKFSGLGKKVPAALENIKPDPETIDAVAGFIALVEQLQKIALAAKEEKTPAEWFDFFEKEILEKLFDFSENKEDEFRILETLKKIKSGADKADFCDKCEFQTFIIPLKNNINAAGKRPPDILRGNITFCEMQPMRNISSKVICVMGLSADAFPRKSRKNPDNLVDLWDKKIVCDGGDLHLWDRTPREDDCLLLLETLLAAKNYLRISFVGRSQNDDKILPPCTPVNKFIDFLCGFFNGEKKNIKKRLVKKHPLQNFEDRETQSPETAKLAAWLASGGKADAGAPELLPFDENDLKEISIDELFEFQKSPSKYICQKRFGIKAPFFDNAVEISDNEPLAGTNFDRAASAFKTLTTTIGSDNNKNFSEELPELIRNGFEKDLKNEKKDSDARGETNPLLGENEDPGNFEDIKRGWKNTFGNGTFIQNLSVCIEVGSRKIHATFPAFCGNAENENYWYFSGKNELQLLAALLDKHCGNKKFTLIEISKEKFTRKRLPNPEQTKNIETRLTDFLDAMALKPEAVIKAVENDKGKFAKPYRDFLLRTIS